MPDDESSEHTPTNPLDETTSNGGSDESDSVADDSGPAEVITAGEWQEGGAWGGPGGIGGDSVRFTLRIPGFWSSGLMILYVLLAIPLFRSVLPGLWSGESGTFWGIVLGLEVLVAAGAAAYRYFKLPDEPQV
ncbi:MAG: hypothetical protein ABEL76_06540, partial [Bradymonadaceae bacterium]